MAHPRFDVRTFSMSAPDDTSRIEEALDAGQLVAEDIVAVMGKTEGNGGVNDFTRGFTSMSLAWLLGERLSMTAEEVEDQVAFVMSGGTEGVMSPHCTVFSRADATDAPVDGEKRLSVAVAFTRDFLPEEIGRQAQIDETARAVNDAMKQAGIDDREDVHFVQIKCPLLTNDRIEQARNRGNDVITTETYKSMGYSRAASALGVAKALGEVPADEITDDIVAVDYDHFSGVASTSAGVELEKNVIILMGNSARTGGDLVISHAVMDDAIDAAAVRQALADVDIDVRDGISPQDAERIVNVFAKAEADPTGQVRGRRHTMLTDTDISSTRHARAAVGAVIASLVGDPMVYVSGGAEHQGPAGGGPVAVIAHSS